MVVQGNAVKRNEDVRTVMKVTIIEVDGALEVGGVTEAPLAEARLVVPLKVQVPILPQQQYPHGHLETIIPPERSTENQNPKVVQDHRQVTIVPITESENPQPQ